MLKLYENIKKRRLALNMTQEQLAEKLGYSDKGMISRIEKGLIDISHSKIIAFAEALRTTPGELMGWIDEDEKKPAEADLQELEDMLIAATPEQRENLMAVAKALLQRK